MRAAIHLFVQNGIDRTTIADIAKQAKVAEGSLYRHFKSKEQLAWHLFSTSLNHFTMELMASVMAKSGAQERVKAFVHYCFTSYEQTPDLFSFLILREHSEFKKYPDTLMHPGQVMLKVVQDAQKEGVLGPAESYLIASLGVGAIIRACVVRMYRRVQQDLRLVAEPVGKGIWKMMEAVSR